MMAYPASDVLLAAVLCWLVCRLCKRKQQISLPQRRQLGYAAGTGKRDDKRHVLLTEDVAEALKDVSTQYGCCTWPALLPASA
jgi:hypothetical protein